MKLTWKLFFSILFVSALCIVVSGHLIIQSNFHSQLNREVETAREYGSVVCHALTSEWENVAVTWEAEGLELTGETPLIRELTSQTAESVSLNVMNQRIGFSLLEGTGELLYSSLPVALDKEMLSSLDEKNGGWSIRRWEDSLYVQVVHPIVCLNETFYVETVRDVTQLYQMHQSQYEMLVLIMAGMMGMGGVLAFLLSKLMLRQVEELARTAQVIADGNLSQRAQKRGRDEISMLADNFNRMADHLEQKISELEEEAERKELFVGAFSHELKTPLTSVIGYADLLRQKELTREQRTICATYIFTEGKRLERLSMRLLDLIVLRRRTLCREPVDVSRMMKEVSMLMKPQLIAARVEYSCQVEPAMLSMEEELMKTVLINLVDNARKAVGEMGRITVIGRLEPEGYRLVVEDNGKGMEAKELTKIRNAFYMVDKSRARKQGGAGLGLSICDEIAKLHGFTISFDSTPGEGTKVTVWMGGEEA